MWGVIRARQGIPYERKADTGFDKHATHLVQFACMPNPEELPADAVTLAFERATHPKLTKLISAEELVHRQKALAMIDKLCSAPIEIAKFLSVGLVPALNAGAEDEDGTVRVLVSHVFILIAQDKHGRDHMHSSLSVPVLQQLLSDPEQQVRAHACKALSALCVEVAHPVTAEVVGRHTVPLLIERAGVEKDDVLPHLLHALKMCLLHHAGLVAAIAHGGVASMASLLESGSPEVVACACHNLFCLAVPSDGKHACLDEGAVPELLPQLVKLLRFVDTKVQEDAAAALMAITVSVPAKHRCVELGVCEVLKDIALDPAVGPKLRGNAIKVITTLAEAPKARMAFEEIVPVLDEFAHSEHDPLATSQAEADFLRHHAKRAKDVITWRP
mmetsp:Transcript_15156/g.44375  ORF Transcript_15156/g.44375 Transcript_15156/m.44375 type:complete len:387 (+) Transcript_15156:40-1200(+)